MQEQTLPTNNNDDDKTVRIELFIAQLLRWGVILSFVIIAIGTAAVLLTRQSGYAQIQLDDVQSIVAYHAGSPEFPNSIGDVVTGLIVFKPYAIISLGLVVLLAIPVLRVAVSVIAFTWQRDWLYVLITLLVFAMLMLSFAIGNTGE